MINDIDLCFMDLLWLFLIRTIKDFCFLPAFFVCHEIIDTFYSWYLHQLSFFSATFWFCWEC